jgi:metal-dependent amidase/aminoacylase/carboxypeptidase family protein
MRSDKRRIAYNGIELLRGRTPGEEVRTSGARLFCRKGVYVDADTISGLGPKIEQAGTSRRQENAFAA